MDHRDGDSVGGRGDQELEKCMLPYYTDSGIWDLWLGALLIAWGLAIWLEFAGLVGGVVAAVGTVWAVWKEVSRPRAGYARPRGVLRLRGRLLVAGSVLIVLGIAGLLVERFHPSVPLAGALPVLLIVCAALVLVTVAHWTATPRFHIHALVVLLAVVAHEVAGVRLWLSVAIAGVAVLTVGVVVLVRFLRANPKISEGADV